MNKVKCLLILVSAFILFADTSFAQNKSLLQIKQSIDSGNFKQALQKLHKTNISSFTTTEKADYYYYNAVADAKENNADLAFRHYAKAKQLYLKAGKTDAAQEINLDLSRLLNSQENNINDPWKYVNEYFDYAVQSNDPLKLTKAYKQVATMKLDEHPKESLFNFKKALYYNAIAKDSTSRPIISSILSPTNKKAIISINTTMLAFSDSIRPARWRISIITGMVPSISMIAKRIIVTDTISLKINGCIILFFRF